MDLRDGAARVVRVACGTVALVRIEKFHQVMAHARALRLARGRRSQRHAAIDLARIGADDFRIEALGQLER